MTAKEYLSKAAVLRRRIKQVETRIEEIRAEVSSPKAIRYDKDMIQSSPSGDALANYVIRLDTEEQKLIRLKEQYLDMYEEIRQRLIAVNPDIYYRTPTSGHADCTEELSWRSRVHSRTYENKS